MNIDGWTVKTNSGIFPSGKRWGGKTIAENVDIKEWLKMNPDVYVVGQFPAIKTLIIYK